MSFYKPNATNDALHKGNSVYSPVVTLLAEERDLHEYPADGWHWFDADAEAVGFFGLPIEGVAAVDPSTDTQQVVSLLQQLLAGLQA